MKKITLLFISVLALKACRGEVNLDNVNKTELNFDQLAPQLRKIYGTYFSSENDSIDYYVLSLDNNYELSHYWTGMNKQLLTKGFNHHFVINTKEFKLSANQGDPFVLFNKKLYFSTELNLAEYNFKEAKFIEIDLSKYLTE